MLRTPKPVRNAIRRYAESNDINLSEILITSNSMSPLILARIARDVGGEPKAWLFMQYTLRERFYWHLRRQR